MKRALATVLELMQWVVMLAMIMPLQYLARWLAQAAGWLVRIPYYRGCVVTKRKLLGTELWQAHDLQLGFYPPEGHPYWDKISKGAPWITDAPGDRASEDASAG